MVTMCFSAGIAHRDLKLENILCEYTDQVSGKVEGVIEYYSVVICCPSIFRCHQ